MSDPVEFLAQYNAWRRGAEMDQPEPKLLGEAIDSVLAEVLRLRIIETAARSLVTKNGLINTSLAYKRLVEACK